MLTDALLYYSKRSAKNISTYRSFIAQMLKSTAFYAYTEFLLPKRMERARSIAIASENELKELLENNSCELHTYICMYIVSIVSIHT